MSAGWELALGVGALLTSYAALDGAFRHAALSRLFGLADERAPVPSAVALGLCGYGGVWLAPWAPLGASRELVWVFAGVGLLLAWNAATRDRDPVARGPTSAVRLLVGWLAVLALWSPLPLVLSAALLSARFGFWQHHAAFPMRVHLLGCAYVACTAVMRVAGSAVAIEAALIVVLVTMMVSHYVITALAKIWLGPKPWSWMVDNRLHYLAASAYSWGWARFVPWPRFRRVVTALGRVEIPLQVGVFLLELTCPLALLDHRLAASYAVAFAGFHVGVWLVSGLCFWDWMLTDLLIASLLVTGPPGLGPWALGLSLVVLLAFPLRHRLWKPMPLGWYDSPLTQRVHWYVRGASGAEYHLDNGFMCPHERLYGKVHGCFAVDTAVLTYHLGECFMREVRDAIVASGPSLEALERVRERFGVRTRSEVLTAAHVQYLQHFFARLNQGAEKQVLPRFARFLKAPGDQMFYWGDGLAYGRQEPVVQVRLVFREEYFDGHDLIRLRDEEVLRFDVPTQLEPGRPSELTPRQMDDYLLGLAAGRLIRVSGARQRYLGADDALGSGSRLADC